MSGRTLLKAEKVFTLASRELVNSVLNGKKSISRAFNEITKLEKFEAKACELLKTAYEKGEISLEKAFKIVELPREFQPAVFDKVIINQLSSGETTLLVDAAYEQPAMETFLRAKIIGGLTQPVKDIKEFVSSYRSGGSLFEKGNCPQCGATYVINWSVKKLNWGEDARAR